MPRPRKDQTEQRSRTVRAHVRPVEYIRIQQAAIRARMTLSEYGRAKLLGEAVVTAPQPRRLDPELFAQLRRIGVNLNQAVYRLHATGQAPPELASAAAAVERFLMDEMDGSEGRG